LPPRRKPRKASCECTGSHVCEAVPARAPFPATHTVS
jgi:hypothetical protein